MDEETGLVGDSIPLGLSERSGEGVRLGKGFSSGMEISLSSASCSTTQMVYNKLIILRNLFTK